MSEPINRPTLIELDASLKDLKQWERFGMYLPGMYSSDIESIRRDRLTASDQKYALFSRWIQKHPTYSWEDVILALEKAGEKVIAFRLRNKSFQVPVFSKQPVEVHNEVNVSDDIVDELEELHSDFVSLTMEVQRNITTEIHEGRESLSWFIRHTVKTNVLK